MKSRSGEDYLEAIYNLGIMGVRSVDVATHLGVSKPSTHNAISNLLEQGYIEKQNYGTVSLTEAGKQIAMSIIKKHNAVKQLLLMIGVSEENAEIDACKIEHYISDETTQKLYKFLEGKK